MSVGRSGYYSTREQCRRPPPLIYSAVRRGPTNHIGLGAPDQGARQGPIRPLGHIGGRSNQQLQVPGWPQITLRVAADRSKWSNNLALTDRPNILAWHHILTFFHLIERIPLVMLALNLSSHLVSLSVWNECKHREGTNDANDTIGECCVQRQGYEQASMEQRCAQ